jgi:competence protein ComEA
MTARVSVPRPRSSPVAAIAALVALLAVATLARTRPPSPAPAPREVASEPTAPLDLNRASAAELERLPRIGPALARRIVDDRRARGRFGSVEALDRVPGIGPGVLARIAPLVVVGPVAAEDGALPPVSPAR